MGLRSSDRIVPLSGVLFFVLLVIGFGVLGGDSPDGDARPATVVAFYDDHYGRQIGAAVLVMLASVCFVLFSASLRQRLAAADADARRTGSVLQASGTMLATGLVVLAGIHIALADAAHDHVLAAASTLNQLDTDIWPVVAVPLLLFVGALAVMALRFAVLPRWAGWSAVVLAVSLVTPVSWFGMILSTVLIAAVGVWLSLAASHVAAPTPPIPQAPRGAMA